MKKVKKMITALATSILVLGCNKYRKNCLNLKNISRKHLTYHPMGDII